MAKSFTFDVHNKRGLVKVPQSIICDGMLSNAQVVLYCCIKAHVMKKDGACMAKMSTLEQECHLSARQISRHIADLEAHRLIEVKRVRKPVGTGFKNNVNEIRLVPLEKRYKAPWEPFNGQLVGKDRPSVRPCKSSGSSERREDTFGTLPFCVLYGTNLQDIAKRLYPYLKARLGNQKHCKTSYEEIAGHLDQSQATIKRGLLELKNRDLIRYKQIHQGIELQG